MIHVVDDHKIHEWANEVLLIEGHSLIDAAKHLNGEFVGAIQKLMVCQGRVIVTGLGKSGHIARKIASTLASTGTPSHFLHPSEALHGDLGMLTKQDALIAVAHSGETFEVNEVAKYGRRLGVPVIVITGRVESTLAKLATHVLLGSAKREACPLNLAPTVSSTIALALGDAIAIVLMRAKGFTDEDFAKVHPGGSIGKRLLKVGDCMRSLAEVGCVEADSNFSKVISDMSVSNFGIVAVRSRASNLEGAITDGDVRRAILTLGERVHVATAGEIMNRSPKTVHPDTLAVDAVQIMERHKITSLFVTEKATQSLLGLLRLHDLIESKFI